MYIGYIAIGICTLAVIWAIISYMVEPKEIRQERIERKRIRQTEREREKGELIHELEEHEQAKLAKLQELNLEIAKHQQITKEKRWAKLQRGDSQAKVSDMFGEPDSVEKENSGKEIWTYLCSSEGKRTISFKDGLIEGLEGKD